MKKIIAILAMAAVLIGISGGVVMAQSQTLNECCRIKQTINVDGVDYTENQWVGPVGGMCDINSDGKAEALVAGETVKTTEDWGIVCLLNTVATVTNWIFYIMTIVAVLMIVYGGFVYITAAGDPAGATKGKSILTFAIIGLAIALIAKLIPSLVRFILGM